MDLGERRRCAERVRTGFVERFGGAPECAVRAPGRVNLIGEHTDYNDGFVLPMAIDRAVWIALRRRSDRQVIVHSLDMPHCAQFFLDSLERGGPRWHEYLKGVAWAMQDAGHALEGWEGVLAGDVPVGAGLSSSAAIEMAVARAFCEVSGLAWSPAEMALLGQRAESRWVGVKCGIMDQMISAAGRAGHALLIDCRSLESEPVPLPAGTAVLVLDTSTRRGLVDSAYNERRAQCDRAARVLGATALRDVSAEQLAGAGDAPGRLDEITLRRARHVITENERTLDAAAAMRRRDARALGALMVASHESLRDDFEVSSPELNAMVRSALDQAGCYGARMTGAGFGGCAVALAEADAAQALAARTAACYREVTGLTASVYVCEASDGAGVVQDCA
ncbi:MAG TPA: galactokinase [Anaerolineae bacterium]|nr:galactokinase [Anaerolineae bacterium]